MKRESGRTWTEKGLIIATIIIAYAVINFIVFVYWPFCQQLRFS